MMVRSSAAFVYVRCQQVSKFWISIFVLWLVSSKQNKYLNAAQALVSRMELVSLLFQANMGAADVGVKSLCVVPGAKAANPCNKTTQGPTVSYNVPPELIQAGWNLAQN